MSRWPANSQKQRLERKLDSLQGEWDVRNEKLGELRRNLAFEVDVSAKFKLERQIGDEEAALKLLEEKIKEIEDTLESLSSKSPDRPVEPVEPVPPRPKPPRSKNWVPLGVRCANWLLWLMFGYFDLTIKVQEGDGDMVLTLALLGTFAGAIDGLIIGFAARRSKSSIQNQSSFLLAILGGAIVGIIWAYAGYQKSTDPLTNTGTTVFAMVLGAVICGVTLWVISQKLLRN